LTKKGKWDPPITNIPLIKC